MLDALARWREQLLRWSPPKMNSSPPSAQDDGWARMAKWLGRAAPAAEDSEPLLVRLKEIADAHSAMLDIGAGAGRIAIPLAAQVGKIIAVEPSPAMRSALQTRIVELGLGNIEVLAGKWPAVDVPPVDVAFCANVAYDVADLGPFLLGMDRVARRRFVELTPRHPLDVQRELWEEFVGWTPPGGPTYLDAVDCLRQLGIEPRVELAPAHTRFRFRDALEAADFYRDRLGLPEGSEIEEKLRARVAANGHMENGQWIPKWQFDETVVLSW